jgi:hypothetical protein
MEIGHYLSNEKKHYTGRGWYAGRNSLRCSGMAGHSENQDEIDGIANWDVGREAWLRESVSLKVDMMEDMNTTDLSTSGGICSLSQASFPAIGL